MNRPKGKELKAKIAVKVEPVYSYTSACCGEHATKEPCIAVDKKEALTQGLGTFRCLKCRRVCKVQRSKDKKYAVKTVQ